jgi:hypothetical protein
MPINPKTIYTKTPKGVLEVKNKTVKLSREEGTVFLSVDGKSTVADLVKKSGIGEKRLQDALEKLTSDGVIRVFSIPDAPKPATAASVAAGASQAGAVGDDLDFTSPEAMTKLNAEAATRAKAEAEAKTRALAAARASAEAKVRQEAEARARALAEGKAKTESEAKVRAEAAAKAASEARAKAEGEAKAAANAKTREEAEGRVKAAMEAKARADAEAKARAEAEARANAEAEQKGAAEAKAREEALSRARAEVEARAHADAELKAKVAVEAQMKALQEALAKAEQRAKQDALDRARMESEIKARAEAEFKARAEVEARAKAAEDAVSRAQAMAEQAARARADSAATIDAVGAGGDAARAHMESAMKALEEAKADARTESDARVEAERRARAEAEARMREDQERKAREEKERKEREEADARTKLQWLELQEQARRATAEAEARAATERKAREEAEARIQVERKAREEAEAKAAAEHKVREEALARARVEAETKARAEVEALIQAERKAREEADIRAQQEIASKVAAERKAREEAERQTEIARKARAEAERKAAAAGSGDSDAARRARAEGEMIARKADEAVTQARAQVEVEKKARAEAEDRAKTETVARVMQEQQLRAAAEGDIQERVNAEIKARERAEMEAEARYRAESAARAKAAADERRKREGDGKETGKTLRIVRPTNWPKALGVGLVVLVALAIGLLHVVPLNNFINGAQDLMSQRLGRPVTIANLRYALLPAPQLTLERVGIGKLQEIKMESIVVSAWPLSLLGDTKNFDQVVIHSLTAGEDSLALISGWIAPQASTQVLSVRRIQMRTVRLAVKAIDVPVFNADITFGPDGTLQRAVLSDPKVRVELTPKDKAVRVALEARNWRLPVGPTVEFDDLTMEAVVGPQEATITAIDGRFGRGAVKGNARANWAGSAIRLEGDFSLTNGDLAMLLSEFTRDFTATGWLNANATYSVQSATLRNLFDDPKVEATFNIEKGSINNVDIVRAIQVPSRDGLRGGKTTFNSLAGSFVLANKRYTYRQLQLSSGPMNASGNVEVGQNGELSGRINAQLGSKSVIVARGNLSVVGNLKTPVLRQ